MNPALILPLLIKLIDLSTLVAIHGPEVLVEYHALRDKMLTMAAENRNPTHEEWMDLQDETDALTERLNAAIVLRTESVEPVKKVVNAPVPPTPAEVKTAETANADAMKATTAEAGTAAAQGEKPKKP